MTIDADGSVRDFPQIAEAQKRTEYYYETLGRLEKASASGDADRTDIDEAAGAFLDAVDGALCDDFNTARAVGRLNDFMRTANELVDGGAGGSAAARALEALRTCGGLLGIMQSTPEEFSARLRDRKLATLGLDAQQIEARIEARREARARKDWAAADAIRDELAGLGIELRDAGDGTDWTVRG